MVSGFPKRVYTVDEVEKARSFVESGYKHRLIVRGNPIRLTEVPIHFRTRVRGKSKLSIRQQLLYLSHLRRLYAYKWHKN